MRKTVENRQRKDNLLCNCDYFGEISGFLPVSAHAVINSLN